MSRTYSSLSIYFVNIFLFPPLFWLTKHSPHFGKLPAITQVLFFQTACEITSRWCVVAWPVSAKKTNCILLSLNYDYIGIQIIYLLKWKPTRQTYFQWRHFGSKFSFLLTFIFSLCRFYKRICCIFQPAFDCCTLQNFVEICFFHVFGIKIVKRSWKNEANNCFWCLHPNAGQRFLKGWKPVLLPMKLSTSIWVQTPKTCFALLSFFCSFFKFFSQKNVKKHISTKVWSSQHPNAGQNIQHIFLSYLLLAFWMLISNT